MTARSRARLGLLRSLGGLRAPRRLPERPARILVIRPDHLGDLVLAAGAVAALRSAFPGARLTAWLGPWGEPVWRHHPALDRIEVCSFPSFTRTAKPNLLAPYVQAVREGRRVRGRFDVALNLRSDFWWGAMVASLAGIPVVGHDVPECRPFLARAVPYQAGLHEAERSLRAVEALAGRPVETPADFQLFPPLTLREGLPAGAIAIHPGAGAEVKLWREEHWSDVAGELSKEAAIVITAGSSDELAVAERIRSRMSAPAEVAGGLDLPQLAAFYAQCRLVLGPDNGPLHVARAVGTPTVTLFGPTDPALFGPRPGDASHEVLRLPWRCIPCGRLDYNRAELAFHLCVKLIEPERVVEAARRVLVAQASRSS